MAPHSETFEPEPQYRLLRKLAAGGMAEIFLAERSVANGTPVRVALKRVLPHLEDDVAMTGMLADEIRLGLRCSHPNIVATLGSGQSRGRTYAVLEYIDGMDLARVHAALLARGERFTSAHAVHLCMELCKGLSHLHGLTDADGTRLGVVHRDVTPPNVLLGNNGTVKLCDFGFAKSKVQRVVTEPGFIKGKFSYLSPEAAMEQPVDWRADLYAVGILLWEMLTMRRLFCADTDYETFKLARSAEIPPLGLPDSVEHEVLSSIVTKCLAREPSARYQSAGALHDALAAYADWQELRCDLGALVTQTMRPSGKPRTVD